MKKILTSGLVIGLITGAVNFAAVMLLGDSPFETPFMPGTEDHQPVMQFAMASGIFTVILTLIGSLIFGLLHRRNPQNAARTWRIIGIVFLVLYGAFPFLAPSMATTNAAILTNILHLIAGIPVLALLPNRV